MNSPNLSPTRTVCLLMAVVFARSAAANPVELGRVGDARIFWEASRGLAGLEVSYNGVRFQPLAGAAALDKQGRSDPAVPLSVEPVIDGNVLRLTVTAPHIDSGGIDPGLVQGLGPWRRLDLSRYAEPYGQTWWPKTTYSVEGDFWFTSHWVMEESDATCWKAPQQANQGNEPFPAALQVIYEPDTAGDFLTIHEVLELRFSRSLWEVVPWPRQQPSQYRDFLAKSLFVDLWGGQPAAELEHFLTVLQAIGRGHRSYYTILQNWEVGGWDAMLPDSMWLPDYPPNPAVGTPRELRELCALGKSMGRFGFRTNYRIVRERSPSYQRGVAHFSVDAQGKRLEYLRCADWQRVASRGDGEIRDTFAPNACFTDQMTSGAAPWSWHDWTAIGGSRSVRQTLEHQQNLARSMKDTFTGPLGSETLSDQHLLGEFVDTGDYGIYNGHQRLFSPEFKLKRLHHLSGFHGMGLMYRFYEMPPFSRFHSSTTTFGNDDVQLDDYRACEILYGNGGYVCHDFANWRYYLTECLLVGHLQQFYSAQQVREVRYWYDGSWATLSELVRRAVVPNIVPWNPQTAAFGRIHVEYENGLNVVVNRQKEDFLVRECRESGVVLPRSGWVAWRSEPPLLAYSAYWPGTTHRVDFLQDDATGLQYLDPRGERIQGVTNITQWQNGQVVISADPQQNRVTIDGKTLTLDPVTAGNVELN